MFSWYIQCEQLEDDAVGSLGATTQASPGPAAELFILPYSLTLTNTHIMTIEIITVIV